MAGLRLGPRPTDFDEASIRASPTFKRWLLLPLGSELVYACRSFVRGGVEDEERLMRRIMIARRANLRGHDCLKRAREAAFGSEDGKEKEEREEVEKAGSLPPLTCGRSSTGSNHPRQSISATTLRSSLSSDPNQESLLSMDTPAVESTRSYRRWASLPDGASFLYSQTYTKGKDGHDWLLKKNIWRRMRYRRENRRKMASLQKIGGGLGRGNEEVKSINNPPQEDSRLVSRAVEDAAAAFDHHGMMIDADAVAALGGEVEEADASYAGTRFHSV